MATVSQGSEILVEVSSGQILTVTTDGEAFADMVNGLPGAGFSSDRLVATARTYGPRTDSFSIRVRAIVGAATYDVAFPVVPGGGVDFNRNESDAIDALIDPKTGETVPLGGSGSVAWDDVTGKPAVIAAGANQVAARTAIGAGTSSFSGSYSDLTNKPTIPTIPGNATTSADGLMAATDKSKLDGIASGANNYSLPAAGAAIGGVKQGAAVADATDADDVVAQLNALLASLRTAGVIAP